jgi:hypothetical protein
MTTPRPLNDNVLPRLARINDAERRMISEAGPGGVIFRPLNADQEAFLEDIIQRAGGYRYDDNAGIPTGAE